MPELTIQQQQYNIFDLGFNKHLIRGSSVLESSIEQVIDDLPLPSVLGSGFYEIPPSQIGSGEIGQNLTMIAGLFQSANFVTGSTGWQILYDGSVEFNSGVFRGSLIAGSIHIPDQDTTANSFHADSTGNVWWGCTETNFDSDPNNAVAYVLKTGAAKFKSIILDTDVVLADLQSGSVLAIQYLSAGTITSKAITLAVTPAGGDAKIQAGKTDFDNTVAGFILGIDDSDGDKAKFYIGDASIYMNWTGSALTVVGGTITGGTIQTATSGARVVLDSSNYIQAYDASYLRVKLDTTSLRFYDSSGNFTGDLYGTSGALGIFSTGTPPAELTLSQGVIDMQQGTWILNMSGNDFTISAGAQNYITMSALNTNVKFSVDAIPNSDDSYDLGASSAQWRNLYIDGIAYIDAIGETLIPNSNDSYDLGSSAKNWRSCYMSDNSSYGIYFGGTKRIYMGSAGVIAMSGALDVSGDVECDDLILNNGGNTIGGDGTHIEFNGTSNAHLVPASGVIDSAQLGTASNYWNGLWYGAGGLNQHSTPLSEKDEMVQLKTFRNKTIIDKKTKETKLVIDKKMVDKDLTSDNGEGIRVDKVIMTLVGAVQKVDDRLNNLENK